MIRRYRELVIVFVILLASLGIFLIYNSVTNTSHSGGELDVIMGACCCSLALIMTYNLLVHLRDLSESDQHQQELKLQRGQSIAYLCEMHNHRSGGRWQGGARHANIVSLQ